MPPRRRGHRERAEDSPWRSPSPRDRQGPGCRLSRNQAANHAAPIPPGGRRRTGIRNRPRPAPLRPAFADTSCRPTRRYRMAPCSKAARKGCHWSQTRPRQACPDDPRYIWRPPRDSANCRSLAAATRTDGSRPASLAAFPPAGAEEGGKRPQPAIASSVMIRHAFQPRRPRHGAKATIIFSTAIGLGEFSGNRGSVIPRPRSSDHLALVRDRAFRNVRFGDCAAETAAPQFILRRNFCGAGVSPASLGIVKCRRALWNVATVRRSLRKRLRQDQR